MTSNESKAQLLVKVNAASLKAKKAERAQSAAARPASKINKTEFVKAHPNLSVNDVIALAAKQGLTISKSAAYTARAGSAKTAVSGPSPVKKRGPGRPRKMAEPTPPAAVGAVRSRGHVEQRLVGLVMEIGLPRVEQMLGALQRVLRG